MDVLVEPDGAGVSDGLIDVGSVVDAVCPAAAVAGADAADPAHAADAAVGPLVGLDAAIDALFASRLAPVTSPEATAAMIELDRLARRVHAAQLELMANIDAGQLHRGDGFASVKALARHAGRHSGGEALDRDRARRMLGALDGVAAAFRAGAIGIDQVHLLGRVHANPRVAGAMVLRQEWFCEQARRCDYRTFEVRVREWERLIDEDGPEPANERTHRNRAARITQNPIDLSWDLSGSFAAIQGAQIDEIWRRYIDAEYLADRDAARLIHGDDTCDAHLARTPAQRRADALVRVFEDAAGSSSPTVPAGFTHSVIWSAETFETMVRRLCGHRDATLDPDTYRCETVDGVPLDPTEAIACAMVHAIRRMIVDARGAVIDLGRRRFFTGAARDAARAASHRCVFTGCSVGASACEIDHLTEHRRGGRTNPGNGAPACGMHNRFRQKGFTVYRDDAGHWHTLRPDGTEIP